jgi:hypothetical protein
MRNHQVSKVKAPIDQLPGKQKSKAVIQKMTKQNTQQSIKPDTANHAHSPLTAIQSPDPECQYSPAKQKRLRTQIRSFNPIPP